MGKQKTKKTILGDSWLDPPKSEKKKKQKNLGKTKKNLKTQKKQFSETLGWTPPFLKTSPELCFFVFLVFQSFFVFFGFSYLGQSVFLLFRSTFKYVSLSLT